MMVTLTCGEQNMLDGLLEHIHGREHQVNDLRKQRNRFQPASPIKGVISSKA